METAQLYCLAQISPTLSPKTRRGRRGNEGTMLDPDPEEMAKWMRDGPRREFEMALEWTMPRLRTEEEMLLVPALLLLFAPLNGVVAPRRLRRGEFGGLRLALTRACVDSGDRDDRRSWSVSIVGPETPIDPEDETTLLIAREEVLANPCATAARIVAMILNEVTVQGYGVEPITAREAGSAPLGR